MLQHLCIASPSSPIYEIFFSQGYPQQKVWSFREGVLVVGSPEIKIPPPPTNTIKFDFRKSQETVVIALGTRGNDNR